MMQRPKSIKSANRYQKACAVSQLSVKAVDGDETKATVTGYASTFDRTPDSYGDIVAPGAFTESLARWASLNEQGKFIPLLYGHNALDPDYNIGRVVSAEEDERGLLITAEFDLSNPKAVYVRKLVQEGRVYQFSFAYDVLKAGEVELEGGGKAYELQKLEIFEISLVQIPANQNATVEDVKSASKAGRRNSKADEDTLKGAVEKMQNLQEQLSAGIAEVTEILNGIIAVEDNAEDADGKSDDDASTKAGAEDQEDKAKALEALKLDSIKAATKRAVSIHKHERE